MRVVIDTNVMLAALRSSTGASRVLLRSALLREVVCLVSVPLWLEYEAVLTRPEHLRSHGLSASEVGRILDAFASVAVPVVTSYRWRPTLTDPDDEMVLETAINGVADILTTFNTADLAPASAFGVTVLRPAQLLRMIR